MPVEPLIIGIDGQNFSAYICKYFLTQRHLSPGSHRPGKVLEFDLGPGKLEFEHISFCPGIVLEFCKINFENIN